MEFERNIQSRKSVIIQLSTVNKLASFSLALKGKFSIEQQNQKDSQEQDEKLLNKGSAKVVIKDSTTSDMLSIALHRKSDDHFPSFSNPANKFMINQIDCNEEDSESASAEQTGKHYEEMRPVQYNWSSKPTISLQVKQENSGLTNRQLRVRKRKIQMLKYSKDVLEEKKFIRDQKKKLQYLKSLVERLKGKPIVECFLNQVRSDASLSDAFEEDSSEEESLQAQTSENASVRTVIDRQESVNSIIINYNATQ